MEEKVLDQVHETSLLGLTIRDDLSWKANAENLSKRAYKRMIIIKNLFPFNVPTVDLIEIYILYIRSRLPEIKRKLIRKLTTTKIPPLLKCALTNFRSCRWGAERRV
jgi:hypothetical protein